MKTRPTSKVNVITEGSLPVLGTALAATALALASTFVV